MEPAMTLCTDNHGNVSDSSTFSESNRKSSESFANILKRAYLDASDEVRNVINTMSRIIADPNTDEEDRASCLDTLTEALFPSEHKGALGIDIEDIKVSSREAPEADLAAARLADEEANFAAALADLMRQKEISQTQLAEATGVGQSAISMMLSRQCRPQRRTVEKIAKALGVSASELWSQS
jgi:DNA-binding phage protein